MVDAPTMDDELEEILDELSDYADDFARSEEEGWFYSDDDEIESARADT